MTQKSLPWAYIRKTNNLNKQKQQTFLEKDTCTHLFIAALFTRAKILKQMKCPSTGEWIKMSYICSTMMYFQVIRTK